MPDLYWSLNRVVRTDYMLNESENEILTKFYAPKAIISTHKKTSSHTIASVLLEQANHQLSAQRGADTLEIGPNTAAPGVQNNLHNTWIQSDATDEARHLKYAIALSIKAPKEKDEYDDARVNLKCNPKYCFKGAGKCETRANKIISVHSAYNITMQQWMNIFEKTGAQIAYIAMHLPIELINQNTSIHNFYRIEFDSGKTYFTFPHDTSLGYVHETKTWREYITRDYIRGKNFGLLIERCEWNGTQCIMTMTKCSMKVETVRTLYPLGEELIIVPDVLDMLETNKYHPEKDLVVSKYHAYKLYTYILSLDQSQLNDKNIMAYYRAMGTRIKIGNTVRNEPWSEEPKKMQLVAERITHIAMLERVRHVKEISFVTQEMAEKLKYIITNPEIPLEQTFNKKATVQEKIIIRKAGKIVAQTSAIAAAIYIAYKLQKSLLNNPVAGLNERTTITNAIKYLLQYRLNRAHDICVMDMETFETVMKIPITHSIKFDTIIDGWYKIDKIPRYIVRPLVGFLTQALKKISLVTLAVLLPINLTRLFHWPWFRLSQLKTFDKTNAITMQMMEFKEINQRTQHAGGEYDASCYRSAKHQTNERKPLIKALRTTTDEKYQRNNETMAQWLEAQNVHIPISIKLTTGPPGCGKTRFVKENYKPSETTIVVPTNKLKKDYEEHGYTAYTPYTVHKANRTKNVIVDECFTLPYSYLNTVPQLLAEHVHLLGDPKQIGFIDFDLAYPDDENVKTRRMIQNIPTTELTTTHRCPQDVTYILNTIFDYDIKSTNNVQRSIHLDSQINNRLQQKLGKGLAQTIVFTQAQKLRYPGAITVHEAQGATYSYVNLILTSDSKYLQSESNAHMIVAITRHTKELHVRTDDPTAQRHVIFTHEFITNLEVMGQLFCTVINQPPEATVTPEVVETAKLITPTIAGPDAIDFILSTVTQGHIDYETLSQSDLDMPYHAIMVNTTPKGGFDEDIKLVEKYRMRGLMYDHTTYINQKNYTMKTMIERYAKESRITPPEHLALASTYMTGRFREQLLLDNTQLKLQPLQELECVSKHAMNTAMKMMEKNTLRRVTELDDEYQEQVIIDFFLKQQHKVKTECHNNWSAVTQTGETKLKAGQGVSAWSKTFNALVSPTLRAFYEALEASFKEDVYIVNGLNDISGLNRVNLCDLSKCKIFEADVSECDAGQNNLTLSFEQQLYRIFNVPEIVIDLIMFFRTQYKLSARDLISMTGEYKKHSGAPDTLKGNSIVSLGLLAVIMKDLKGAIVFSKGDDLLVLGPELEIDHAGELMFNINCSMTLKTVQDNAPQFINYFITQDGPVIDPIRLAMKVKSKPLVTNQFTIHEDKFTHLVSGTPPAQPFILTTDSTDTKRKYIDAFYDNGNTNLHQLERIMIQNAEENEGICRIHLTRFIKDKHVIRKITRKHGFVTRVYASKNKQTFMEYLQSVKDRLRLLDSPSKYAACVACASKYYTITPEAVEGVISWLKTLSVVSLTEFSNYYTLVRRPIIEIKPLEVKDNSPGKCWYQHMDLGSNNNDCFDRVIRYLKPDANLTNLRSAFPPGEMIPIEAAMMALSENGMSASIVYLSKDGKIYWYDCGMKPLVFLHNNHFEVLIKFDNEIPEQKSIHDSEAQCKRVSWASSTQPTLSDYKQIATSWKAGGRGYPTQKRGISHFRQIVRRYIDKGWFENTSGSGPEHVCRRVARNQSIDIQPIPSVKSIFGLSTASQPDKRKFDHQHLVNIRPRGRLTGRRPGGESDDDISTWQVMVRNVCATIRAGFTTNPVECVSDRRGRNRSWKRLPGSTLLHDQTDISRQLNNKLRRGVRDVIDQLVIADAGTQARGNREIRPSQGHVDRITSSKPKELPILEQIRKVYGSSGKRIQNQCIRDNYGDSDNAEPYNEWIDLLYGQFGPLDHTEPNELHIRQPLQMGSRRRRRRLDRSRTNRNDKGLYDLQYSADGTEELVRYNTRSIVDRYTTNEIIQHIRSTDGAQISRRKRQRNIIYTYRGRTRQLTHGKPIFGRQGTNRHTRLTRQNRGDGTTSQSNSARTTNRRKSHKQKDYRGSGRKRRHENTRPTYISQGGEVGIRYDFRPRGRDITFSIAGRPTTIRTRQHFEQVRVITMEFQRLLLEFHNKVAEVMSAYQITNEKKQVEAIIAFKDEENPGDLRKKLQRLAISNYIFTKLDIVTDSDITVKYLAHYVRQ
uniref:Replicase n=1 Tax=Hepeviridae sp. TaxID=2715178 RepID=A0A6M3YUN4_9VIRU|nr:MAG: replicase [Hepeviridae sp.]